MLFSLLFLGIFVFLVIKSIKVIGPKEMAVLITLGRPTAVLDSGLNFVLYLICSLLKFPKKMFNFDYPAREVITKAGKYKGVRYGVQVIKVDSVVYMRFPRGRSKKLIEIVKSDVPTEEEALKNWTEEVIIAAIRLILGQKTWKECTEEIEKLKKEIEDVFKNTDGALLKAGFNADDLIIVIKEIRLSKELEEALMAPEKKRLEKDAAEFESEAQARKWVGMIFHAMALAEGKSVKVIQKRIRVDEKLQKKFMEYAMSMNSDIEMADRKAIFKFVNEGKNGGGLAGNLALFARLLGEALRGDKEPSPRKKRPKEITKSRDRDQLREAIKKKDYDTWRKTTKEKGARPQEEGYSEEEEE